MNFYSIKNEEIKLSIKYCWDVDDKILTQIKHQKTQNLFSLIFWKWFKLEKNGQKVGFIQNVFLAMMPLPMESYCCLVTQILRKVSSEARMEPPIQVEYIRSWGARMRTFRSFGAIRFICGGKKFKKIKLYI